VFKKLKNRHEQSITGKVLKNLPTSAASYGERTRGLVVPRRRRAVILSES